MHRNLLRPVILLSISFLFIHSGCNICSTKKINCKGYDDVLVLQWFPYQQGEKFIFRNTGNNIDSLTIRQVTKSEPREITIGGYGNNATCDVNYTVTSTEADAQYVPRLQIYSYILYNSSGDEVNRNTQLILFGERFDTEIMADTGFVRSSNTLPYVSTQFFNSLTLNNSTFTNVQRFTIDTNIIKFVKLRSLYISKNNGIVGYTAYPSNVLWVKQ